MKTKSIKVIFDTNVWVSFLIGKQLSVISKYIWNKEISIIVCEQLLQEIKVVTSREKLIKYFPPNNVKNLLNLL